MSLVLVGTPTETFTPTESGAIATIFWECCRRAERDGIEPTVIAVDCAAQPYAWPRKILIERRKLRGKLDLALARAERKLGGWTYLFHRTHALRVAQAIRREGLDRLPLVLSNDPELAVFLRRRFPKAFIVHWFHNQLPCKERARQRFAASVDCAFAVSDFTARWVEAYYGFQSGQVRTVYNAVDSERFRPAERTPDGPPVINFLGRMGIEKAPDLFLHAALKLTERTREFRLQMLGSNHWDRFEQDEYQDGLRKLVQQLEERGIEVRQPGHIGRPQLPDELLKAQIHVVPSRWDEPFGLVTLEGMAAGLATVASRTGGTPEVVGDAGLLFERDAVEELVGHLEPLVRDLSVRVEYGRRGRQRAEAFTWERTWQDLRSLVGV